MFALEWGRYCGGVGAGLQACGELMRRSGRGKWWVVRIW